MITHNQLIRHNFLVQTATEKSPFYLHGKVNGVLSGGIFHFPMVDEWYQCKNISQLKYLYKKVTGEKLEPMSDDSFKLVLSLVN